MFRFTDDVMWLGFMVGDVTNLLLFRFTDDAMRPGLMAGDVTSLLLFRFTAEVKKLWLCASPSARVKLGRKFIPTPKN